VPSLRKDHALRRARRLGAKVEHSGSRINAAPAAARRAREGDRPRRDHDLRIGGEQNCGEPHRFGGRGIDQRRKLDQLEVVTSS
jgi:hypothetical protein